MCLRAVTWPVRREVNNFSRFHGARASLPIFLSRFPSFSNRVLCARGFAKNSERDYWKREKTSFSARFSDEFVLVHVPRGLEQGIKLKRKICGSVKDTGETEVPKVWIPWTTSRPRCCHRGARPGRSTARAAPPRGTSGSAPSPSPPRPRWHRRRLRRLPRRRRHWQRR